MRVHDSVNTTDALGVWCVPRSLDRDDNENAFAIREGAGGPIERSKS